MDMLGTRSSCLPDTAHVDYTSVSGVERLDVVLPDEADKLRQTPFAIIQACFYRSSTDRVAKMVLIALAGYSRGDKRQRFST